MPRRYELRALCLVVNYGRCSLGLGTGRREREGKKEEKGEEEQKKNKGHFVCVGMCTWRMPSASIIEDILMCGGGGRHSLITGVEAWLLVQSMNGESFSVFVYICATLERSYVLPT